MFLFIRKQGDYCSIRYIFFFAVPDVMLTYKYKRKLPREQRASNMSKGSEQLEKHSIWQDSAMKG